jgi:hypothetical protein
VVREGTLPNTPEWFSLWVNGKAAYEPKSGFWYCRACSKEFSVIAGASRRHADASAATDVGTGL